MADKKMILSDDQLENVSGGILNRGSSGPSNSGSSRKTTLRCPSCGIKGPHTIIISGRVTCDNCNHTYMI